MEVRHCEREVLELMGMEYNDVEHCGSCHEDVELGYGMPEYEIPEFGEGHFAELCCEVSDRYEKWHEVNKIEDKQ
jgi:hypothetical protein